jgi:chromosome segregation ATPase
MATLSNFSIAFISPKTFIPPTQTATSSYISTPSNFITSTRINLFLKKNKNIENIDDGSIDVYVTAICSLTDDLKQKNDEIEELKSEIESLEQTLKKKNHQGDQLSEFYPVFSAEMAKKDEEIEKLKKELESSTTTTTTTEGKIDDKVTKNDAFFASEIEDKMNALKEKVEEYEKENSVLSQELTNKEVEIMEYKHNYDQEMKDNEKEMKFMNDKINSLEKKLSSASKASSKKDSSTSTLEGEIKSKDEQIKTLQEQLSDLKEKMTEQQKESTQKYNTVKEEMELVVKSSKELRTHLQDREKELEFIKNKESYWQERLEQLQKEMEELKNQKETVNGAAVPSPSSLSSAQSTPQSQPQPQPQPQPQNNTVQPSNNRVVAPMISQQNDIASKRRPKTSTEPSSSGENAVSPASTTVKRIVKKVSFTPNDVKHW